ncbi:HIT family protein [Streptomyces sp. NPDC058289]|uniref:HIT family protein n=1 Tax=Streptomyces sp. NPDC058289 TaxID=3346425 RepID=UPI0036EE9926
MRGAYLAVDDAPGPTMAGKVLVAPKAHIEHVVRDMDETAFSSLMLVVRKVALAVEAVFAPEGTNRASR